MEIYGDVDFPKNNQTINQNAVIVQGWCFSEPESEINIEISIDEKVMDTARWGLARFDVYKKYGTENSYESGFISRTPLSVFDDGPHKFKVTAKANNKTEILKEFEFEKKFQFGSDPVQPAPAGGIGQFKSLGTYYFQKFIDLCEIKPEYTVLDIGCGMGRMTMPFTRFLNENGKYCGIDTIKFAIDFCQKNISARYRNFFFEYANVYNKLYNIKSNRSASSFIFPYEDNTFDFVFLLSVFTHMLPDDLSHYLSEIQRVLKKDGICFATFFIYNNEKLLDQKFISDFKFQHDVYRLRYDENPESAIAYDEKYLRELLSNLDFKILEPIRFEHPINQDFIIIQK